MTRLHSEKRHADLEESFRIVFWGEVARGFSRAQVAAAFARRFGITSRRQLVSLFSGRVIILKRNLSTAQAHRYITAIQELGGICRMESEFRDYFSDTECKPRKSVSFLQAGFEPDSLTLAAKESPVSSH